MKILRYILTVPVCFIVIGFVYWAFEFLFDKIFSWLWNLDLIWFLLILFFFGGGIWGLFQLFATMMSALASLISPKKQFSFWVITILGILNGLLSIIMAWYYNPTDDGKSIFILILFTTLVVEMTFALVTGAAFSLDED